MSSSPLDGSRALGFAAELIASADARERIEATLDPRDGALLVSGRHGFGFFGAPQYVALRVAVPASPQRVALAVAAHLLEDPHAGPFAVRARVAELPLALALVLCAEGPP